MIDINELKKSLSRRGHRPALKDGEPILTRTMEPGIIFISADQLVTELSKRGKVINQETLVISEAVNAPVAEPTPEILPAPKPETEEVWTREELEKIPWNDLRKLATLWPDVHGNKGKEHVLAGLTGKAKSGPK